MRLDGRIVAVTGAGGFIGRNLVVRLRELGARTHAITRLTPAAEARAALGAAEAVIHLAGAVRPAERSAFDETCAYAAWAAGVIEAGGRRPLVILGSSVKAEEDSEYARSKRACELIFSELAAAGAATAAIYRLPNVFGKWARHNYNSAVATFCHNLARDLPIRIDNPEAPLFLLYVDDLAEQWCELIADPPRTSGVFSPREVYATTVGEVAAILRGFAQTRTRGEAPEAGAGLERALYATFIAALPAQAFSYPLAAHRDPRGCFAEMLRTHDSGQVSFFTANPGVTRGGHYHHSKVEKFLVVHGEALFRFRHILSGETFELRTSAADPVVVETIPGWTHDVTNVGDGQMVCLLWASEVFDRERPDTVAMPV